MKTRRIQGPDIQAALREVRRALGADAVIMSTRETEEGIEIIAAAPSAPRAAAPAAAPRAEQRAARTQQATREALRRAAAAPEARAPGAQSAVEAAAPQAASKSARGTGAPAAKASSRKVSAEQDLAPRRDAGTGNAARPAPSRPNEGARADAGAAPARRRAVSPLASLAAGMARPSAKALAEEAAARAELASRVEALGLAGDVRARIAAAAESARAGGERDPLAATLAASIEVEGKALIRKGGRVAVLGGTGVGKTTTIAKLAAHFARRHGPGQVALVNADQYRIGASDQLRRFGRLIGVPTFEVHGRDELDATLYRLRDRRLVLVDTAGIAAHDVRFAEQVSLLDGAGLDLYLALSLNTQAAVLARCVQSFSALRLRACILTKEDEALSLGAGLSMALRHALPLAYVTHGPGVPADIRVARAERIAARAVAMADAAREELGGALEVAR